MLSTNGSKNLLVSNAPLEGVVVLAKEVSDDKDVSVDASVKEDEVSEDISDKDDEVSEGEVLEISLRFFVDSMLSFELWLMSKQLDPTGFCLTLLLDCFSAAAYPPTYVPCICLKRAASLNQKYV